MFSVVIADDEPLIIKGLMKMVDWKMLNTEVVATARNGEQLIERLEEFSPDIVVSDISMPKQSGIDVVHYIKEKGLGSKVIFLSAYQEFSYAKEALRYGVVEYLLKPVAKEELENAIRKAERALEDKMSLEYLQEDKTSTQAVFKSVTTEYEFKDLYGRFKEMGVPVSGVYYTGVCFCVRRDEGKEKSRGDFELLRFTVFKKIEEQARKKKKGFCLKREAVCCSMVFFYDQDDSGLVWADIRDIVDSMEKFYQVKLTAGIGKQVKELSELKYAHKTAFFACQLYYFKQEEIICYDQISKDYHKSFEDYHEAYQVFVRGVLRQDAKWEKNLETCLELIGELHYGNRVVAENRCIALLMELSRELNRYCRIEPYEQAKYENFVSRLRDIGTFQGVKAQIHNYLNQFIERNVFADIGSENKTIREIRLYIRDHYQEEIHLKLLAKEFYMNPYYFSTFFKQKTGKNFKDYLVEVRMGKAMEILLEDTGLSTQELARKVGYQDARTFSEKFKQYYGESPVNYKKSMKI